MLCLCLTGNLLKKQYAKQKKRNLVLAAAFGAVSDAAVVLVCGTGLRFPLLFLGIALMELFLGAGIAYGRQRVWQNGALLFAISALFAGFLKVLPVRNVGLFCFAGSLLFPVLNVGAETLFRAKQTQSTVLEVWIFQNKKEKKISALMDTGNRLRLYGSQIPVVLVDEDCLGEWIKEAERTAPQKLVFVPYKGVGGKGILRGVRLQCRVNISQGDCIGGEVAAVAAEHRMFDGCEYQMILQPEVLKLPAQKEIKPKMAG